MGSGWIVKDPRLAIVLVSQRVGGEAGGAAPCPAGRKGLTCLLRGDFRKSVLCCPGCFPGRWLRTLPGWLCSGGRCFPQQHPLLAARGMGVRRHPGFIPRGGVGVPDCRPTVERAGFLGSKLPFCRWGLSAGRRLLFRILTMLPGPGTWGRSSRSGVGLHLCTHATPCAQVGLEMSLKLSTVTEKGRWLVASGWFRLQLGARELPSALQTRGGWTGILENSASPACLILILEPSRRRGGRADVLSLGVQAQRKQGAVFLCS